MGHLKEGGGNKGDQQRRDSHAQGFAKIAPNGRMVTKLGEQGSLVS